MRAPNSAFILFAAIFLPMTARTAVGTKPRATAGDGAILRCLLSRSWALEDLARIGVKERGPVWVGVEYGTVPDTSPLVRRWNVMVYSPRKDKAWLLFARRAQDGVIHAIPNAYYLTRERQGWAAGEGNGGVWTYRAMGAYADHLSHRKPVKVMLPVHAPAECVSDF